VHGKKKKKGGKKPRRGGLLARGGERKHVPISRKRRKGNVLGKNPDYPPREERESGFRHKRKGRKVVCAPLGTKRRGEMLFHA